MLCAICDSCLVHNVFECLPWFMAWVFGLNKQTSLLTCCNDKTLAAVVCNHLICQDDCLHFALSTSEHLRYPFSRMNMWLCHSSTYNISDWHDLMSPLVYRESWRRSLLFRLLFLITTSMVLYPMCTKLQKSGVFFQSREFVISFQDVDLRILQLATLCQ